MNYNERHKTFIKAIMELNHSNQRAKVFLQDKRLTQTEKRLLESLILFQKGKLQKAIEYIKQVHCSNDFLSGFKFFLLGSCYNNLGLYPKSITHLKKSCKYYFLLGDKDHLFRPLSNLVICFTNLKANEQAQEHLKELSELPLDTRRKELTYLNAKISVLLIQEKAQEALKLTEEILQQYKDIAQSQLAFFLVHKLRAEFKLGRVEECLKTLENYKRANGFKIKSNYKYIQLMLDFLYKNKPIYVYKKDFKENLSLYYELKVIKFLESQDFDNASKAWKQLQELNPYIYEDQFNYTGDISLFSKALEQFDLKKKDTSSLSRTQLLKYTSHLDKLCYILNSSEGMVNKEEIIKLLWNEEWSPENDSRLRNLIFTLKKRNSLKIKAKNGQYYIAA